MLQLLRLDSDSETETVVTSGHLGVGRTRGGTWSMSERFSLSAYNQDMRRGMEQRDSFKTLYSQVGGHVNMKILNERFVCKPLNLREVRFYQKLPHQLCDFVPKYHGTVSSTLEDLYDTQR